MPRWRWGLLIFELFLFVLILVLPQVDLPDCAFHRGSAPTVSKASVSSPPMTAAATVPSRHRQVKEFAKRQEPYTKNLLRTDSPSLFSLLCTFLC